MLDAFAQVRAQRRDVHLWIVGEGLHLGDVRRAAERDPAGVFASGAVPHEQVAAILAASDIVVCPYPADAPAYFSPLKLVEAMAARRALLASNVASVRSHVTHGESAWLFEPGSVASWRAGLDALVASRSLRERLAAAAHERFRRSHTWEARARELIAMIAALRPAAVKEAAS
ncbi:MAG: glycosyltransferase family 4 protein [Planctomycetota bacterium]